MMPITNPDIAPFSLAKRVKIPNRNMAKMGPFAKDPTLLTDSMTESEIPPTKKEKNTIKLPQKTVNTRERKSCFSAGISLNKGFVDVFDGRRRQRVDGRVQGGHRCREQGHHHQSNDAMGQDSRHKLGHGQVVVGLTVLDQQDSQVWILDDVCADTDPQKAVGCDQRETDHAVEHQ